MELVSTALASRFFTPEPPGKPAHNLPHSEKGEGDHLGESRHCLYKAPDEAVVAFNLLRT